MLSENLKELVKEIINQKTEKQNYRIKSSRKRLPQSLI